MNIETAIEPGEDLSEVQDTTQQSQDTSGTATAPPEKTSSGKSSRGLRLARLAGAHALVALVVLSLFAAADSWNVVTGLSLAGGLCIVTGILVGVTLPTLIHEWFHFLGARWTRSSYDIPSNVGLFLYEWDYPGNTLRQFFIMSIAGSVGGLVAVILLWNAVPVDSWGRGALRGAAIASFVFAACVEWPVLQRTRSSGDPQAELSKVGPRVLSRCFVIASVCGIIMTVIFVP